MLWPGYATPAQSPWHLQSEIPLHPHSGSGLWSRSPPLLQPLPLTTGFDLPLRTIGDADVKIEPLSSASPDASHAIKDGVEEGKPFDPADYIRSFSPESAVEAPAAPLDSIVIKDEIQVVPDLQKSPSPAAAHSPEAQQSQVISDLPPIKRSPSPEANNWTERVPSPGIDPAASVPKKEELESGNDPEFLGLRLLSESIEHFVSTETKKEQESIIRALPEASGIGKNLWTQMDGVCNPLDVLCAAALSQQNKESVVAATPSPVTPASARGCQPEFDFRSKLAELQRKYKEKQKELSNLSKSVRNSFRKPIRW